MERGGHGEQKPQNKNMKNQKTSQCDRILSHLKRWKSITTAQAVDKYRILRLGARIHEMKRRGIVCRHDMIRAGSARIAKYTLLHS